MQNQRTMIYTHVYWSLEESTPSPTSLSLSLSLSLSPSNDSALSMTSRGCWVWWVILKLFGCGSCLNDRSVWHQSVLFTPGIYKSNSSGVPRIIYSIIQRFMEFDSEMKTNMSACITIIRLRYHYLLIFTSISPQMAFFDFLN